MGWRFNDETEKMELFGITFEPEKENVLTMEWKRLIDGMQTLCRRNENVLTMEWKRLIDGMQTLCRRNENVITIQ